MFDLAWMKAKQCDDFQSASWVYHTELLALFRNWMTAEENSVEKPPAP